MKFKVTRIERKTIATKKEYDLNPFTGIKFIRRHISNQHNYSYKINVWESNFPFSKSLTIDIIILDRWSFGKKLIPVNLHLSELRITKEKEEFHVTHDGYSDHFFLLSAIINNNFKGFTELTKEEFLKDIQNTFKI